MDERCKRCDQVVYDRKMLRWTIPVDVGQCRVGNSAIQCWYRCPCGQIIAGDDLDFLRSGPDFVVGQCGVCGVEVRNRDVVVHPEDGDGKVVSFPGLGFVCTKHPGAVDLFNALARMRKERGDVG
jgi:hypothetical protein